MINEFRLPELGERIESGTVVKMRVNTGDTIAKNQLVMDLETEKVVLEVPSPVGGRVKEIFVKEGDTAKVGQLILTVDSDGMESSSTAKKEAPASPKKEAAPAAVPKTIKQEAPVKIETAPAPEKEVQSQEKPQATPQSMNIPIIPPRENVPGVQSDLAPAAPSVRKLARELGVDINQVNGSGPGGRISAQDVQDYAKNIITSISGVTAAGLFKMEPLPDFSQWGETQRQQMTGIRRKIADHLTYAWATIPHVTQYDKADITDLDNMRKKFDKKAEALGGKLTVTAILLKVMASALKTFPQFNASVDMAQNEIVYKSFYNIGVAVDTDRGLLVPIIRDVDKKNILQIAVELHQASERARSRKTAREELQGGSFTITNLGGIGGTNFAPIINSPEVAILGVARAQWEPVYQNGQFIPRLMLPLALSYDHRVIDGADGIRFLRWISEALQQPFLLALEG